MSTYRKGHRLQLCDSDDNDIKPVLREVWSTYVRDSFPRAPVVIRERLVDTMILRCQGVLYRRLRHGDGIYWLPDTPLESAGRPSSLPAEHDGSVEAGRAGESSQTHKQALRKWPIPRDVSEGCENISDFLPAAPIEQQTDERHERQVPAGPSTQSSVPDDILASAIASMSEEDWDDANKVGRKVVCPVCVECIPAQTAIIQQAWRFVSPYFLGTPWTA